MYTAITIATWRLLQFCSNTELSLQHQMSLLREENSRLQDEHHQHIQQHSKMESRMMEVGGREREMEGGRDRGRERKSQGGRDRYRDPSHAHPMHACAGLLIG